MPSIRSVLSTSGMASLFICASGCPLAKEGSPAYSLAQGCYSLQVVASEAYVEIKDARHYEWQVPSRRQRAGKGASFFLKPTGLGTYFLYDHEGGYLAATSLSIERRWQADEKAEWRINNLEIEQDGEKIAKKYTLFSTFFQHRLTAESSKLTLSADGPQLNAKAIAFDFVAQEPSSCKAFPEANLDAEVSKGFYAAKSPREPVRGFVDMHTHIAFPKALGALAMSGNTFHRFGIEHALPSCSLLHGNNGEFDLLETQHGGASTHSTDGYPTFTYWPNRGTQTHVQTYYRWVQRAYLSGLRILVTNATGNPTFCQLLGILHPNQAETNCKSDQDVELQTRYIYDMQDYVDAQEGGPDKGWFRVVTSSSQARQVISQNKLAVVLGTEYGTLFECREGSSQCNEAYIDAKLEQLHALGVRSVFPIHRFDNAFGGAKPQGGSGGAWMNLTSKISTGHIDHLLDLLNPTRLLFKPIGGHYWELEPCPQGVSGTRDVKSMQDFARDDLSFLNHTVQKVPIVGSLASRLLDWTFTDKLKPLAEYSAFSQGQAACNVRPLQEIGSYLINKVIDKGMILEIDHMSYYTLLDALDILEERRYAGLVSSHGWLENLPEIRRRIFRLGGLMAASNGRPGDVAQMLVQYAREMEGEAAFGGVGIGTDIQGVTSQPSADSDVKITYPFASYDGFVRFTEPKTGQRRFDYATEGMAHYGLLAEWVENLRQVDARQGTDATTILMNSAEAYLQMWEKSEARATW